MNLMSNLRVPVFRDLVSGCGGAVAAIPKPFMYIGAGALGLYVIKAYKNAKRRQKWAKVEKDTVILHQLDRGSVTPSPSPFVLKLETYLRMAKIPYENDFEQPFGPKGKTPWITLNGEDFTDSQLCIEMLGQKYEKDFSSHLSPVEQSIARAFQVMCDEHLFWPLVLWRYVYTKWVSIPLVVPGFPTYIIPLVERLWKKAAHGQGIGRHSEAQVMEIGVKDLRAMSKYLGTKPYFMGDKPTEMDCSLFGMLALVVWAMPDSSYEHLVHGELINLKHYCERMKNDFWPDWDRCLYHSS